MTDSKQHWERVYAEKTPLDVSWYQKEPAVSLRLIEHSGLAKEAAIIDVGGGASLLVDRLLDAGYSRLTVLDISARALEFARTRLGPRAHQVDWVETDIRHYRPAHSYALWHDRAVFHFLTVAEDRRRYLQTLRRALPPGGHLVLAAFAIGGPTRCSGLDIVQYDAAKLSAELGDQFRLLEQIAETHLTPAGKEQRFSYFHLTRSPA